MLILRLALGMFSVGMMVLGAGLVSAQNYPEKPIRIITSPAGGSGDFVPRVIAQVISGPLGQPVIIDNRQTNLIPDLGAKAPPDGYTLILAGQSFWILPLMEKTSYDPFRDFSPVTLVNTAPNILVVHPSVPAKSVKELIALAKARPGQLNYGSSPNGSTPHLAAELFKSMAGVDIVRITYQGGAQTLNDLLGGQIQLTFAVSSAALTQFVKAGRLRALAVTSAQPTALAPGLPTVAASGVPGYESMQTQSILAPAKTPEAIINRLNQEISRALKSPDVKEKLLASGVEAVSSSPEELASSMKSEVAKMGKVIKGAGIRND